MGEYQAGDKISRGEAWEDLKGEWGREGRFKRPLHWYKAFWVNVARIIGVADRDRSQNVGMVLSIAFVIALIVVLAEVFS